MRIVYSSTPPFADCDAPLLKAFCSLGHEVHYFLHIAPYSRQSTAIDIQSLNKEFGVFPASVYKELSHLQTYLSGVKIYVVNNPIGKNNGKALRLSFKEAQLIRQIGPDIIHYVETPAPFHLPLLFKNRRNVVCTIHDPIPHLNKMGWKESTCRWIASLFIKRFVLLNRRQTAAFCRRYHIKQSRIFYSTLGPYPSLTGADSLDFPAGKYILLFGRITPYKGIERAIAAMDRITSAFPEVSLVIAGPGEVYFDRKLYEGKPYIRFINKYFSPDEQVSLFRHSLFVLCPYTEATQSGVVQTAFGLDTPVVVTDVGALADAVEDGKTGRIVKGGNLEALAETVKSLLDDERSLDRMREIIRERNEGNKAWMKIAREYIDVYHAG